MPRDVGAPAKCGLHWEYFTSLPGIANIITIVAALLTFIFAVVMWFWFWGVAAWIVYVFSLVVALVAFLLLIAHFTALFPKLPGPWVLIELFTYLVLLAAMGVIIVLDFIYAAVFVSWPFAWAIYVSAAFAIVTFVALGILVVLVFLIWRSGAIHITSAHALFEKPHGSALDRSRAADTPAANANAFSSSGARFDRESNGVNWGTSYSGELSRGSQKPDTGAAADYNSGDNNGAHYNWGSSWGEGGGVVGNQPPPRPPPPGYKI